MAILSRGYKKIGKEPIFLEPGFKKPEQKADPLDAGDEPAMLAGVFRQRVGVGRKRHEVGTKLLQKAEVDVLLLDDGFQHRQLSRDLDLLLLGSDWSGWLIPAGPFREPRSALGRADLYLVTGARERWESFLTPYSKRAIFFGSLQAKSLVTLEGDQWKECPLGLLDKSKILTVSGIADPTSFYRMIHDWEGEIVDTIGFPDHHFYSAKDWQRINRAARNVDLIVTTEKDILKLVRFPFAKEKLLALRVEMVIENGSALVQAIEDVIENRQRQ